MEQSLHEVETILRQPDEDIDDLLEKFQESQLNEDVSQKSKINQDADSIIDEQIENFVKKFRDKHFNQLSDLDIQDVDFNRSYYKNQMPPRIEEFGLNLEQCQHIAKIKDLPLPLKPNRASKIKEILQMVRQSLDEEQYQKTRYKFNLSPEQKDVINHHRKQMMRYDYENFKQMLKSKTLSKAKMNYVRKKEIGRERNEKIDIDEILSQIKSKEFKNKLSNSSPEVFQYFILLIKQFLDSVQLNQDPRDSRYIYKVGSYNFSKQAAQMMWYFKQGMELLVRMQLVHDKNICRTSKEIVSFNNLFKAKKKRQSIRMKTSVNKQLIGMVNKQSNLIGAGLLMGQSEKIKFGPAIEKLRHFIAKNFLSISLSEVEDMDFRTLNLMYSLDLQTFKLTLSNIFNEDQQNLGQKYLQLNENQFKNIYLRNMANVAPQLAHHFRVFTGPYDDRGKFIRIDSDVLRYVMDDPKIDNIFEKQVQNFQYQQHFKSQFSNHDTNIIEQDDSCDEQGLINAIYNFYFNFGRDHGTKAIDPNFVRVKDNTLYFSNVRISKEQAEVLRDFLRDVRDYPQMIVRQAIFDDCQISDDILSHILDGIIAQTQQEDGSFDQVQQLNTFIYSNNQIGLKSISKFKFLHQNLIEIKLNNIKFEETKGKFQILINFLDFFKEGHISPFLMKFKLSNIDLNHDKVIEQLVFLLQNKFYLQSLTLSYTNLTPQKLLILAQTLIYNTLNLKSLDLGHNKLIFEEINDQNSDNSNELSTDHKASLSFVEDIINFFQNCQQINHINFSGMNLDKDNLKKLCECFAKCKLLQVIHLDDNGITNDLQLLESIIEQFGLSRRDVESKPQIYYNEAAKGKAMQKQRIKTINKNVARFLKIEGSLIKKEQQKRQSKLIQPKKLLRFQQVGRQSIDLNKHLKQYMTQNHFKPTFTYQLNKKDESDYIKMSNSINEYQFQKQCNHAKQYAGIQRTTTSQSDSFVLSRVLNHPELIFNQKPETDTVDHLRRFFVSDASSRWDLSNNSECYSCDKHMYLQIHYRRGLIAQNQDLVEIRDPEIIDELSYQFKKDYLKYRTTTPLICGTPIKRLPHQGIFDRKLKMLRTSLFCLLAISRCRNFSDSKQEYKSVEEGVQKYLRNDAYELLQEMEIRECMNGWRHVLNDLALNCELTDMRAINLPDLNAYNIEQQDWFSFAAFVPPGYHQILIFDPKYSRAYYKDFMVKLNKRDHLFPEYPAMPTEELKKHVPDMWAQWLEDTQQDYSKMIQIESTQSKLNMDKYIKGEQDQVNCKKVLSENFELIVILQKYLAIRSNEYPQIDWDPVIDYFDFVQENEQFDLHDVKQIQRQYLEINFISSTRTDKERGLEGQLQRGELLDFIMRSATQWIKSEYGQKVLINQHLGTFLQIFINPILQLSIIEEQRESIRKSKRLNELLFDNHEGLQGIFEYYKVQIKIRDDTKYFTLKSAKTLLADCIGRQLMGRLTDFQISDCFVSSMMTVHDEYKNYQKYFYLHFVEFQEFICRAAMIGFKDQQENVDQKVFYLLQILWDNMNDISEWTDQSIPLVKPNQKVKVF